MKKSIVMALALALFAAPAFAGISGTAHDLSSGNNTAYAGTSDEICVYCHTPHGAGSVGFAPLWNRTAANATTFYNTGTMDHVTDLNGLNGSDAPLCLSCHDGSSLTDGLNNEPNSGAVTFAGGNIATDANLGKDLNNDHPVGFVFNAALDTEIKTPATAKVNFGNAKNEMWCSSCHDVHSDSMSPFLVMDNSGSALCLDCHQK